MADPRLAIGFEDLDIRNATFIIDNSTITYDATKVGGSAAVGKAVTMSAAKTVALAADGEEGIGRLVSVEHDLRCTVTYKGAVVLPGGEGATLTPGKKIVGALSAASAKGYIREV